MKRKQYIAISCLFVLLSHTLTGCANADISTNIANAKTDSINYTAEDFSNDVLLEEIYCVESVDYRIYSSELLDLYFICCALYFDFDSSELLPNIQDDAFYSQVAAYFRPYKDHPFMKEFGKYVDINYHAQRDGVVYPLLMYIFSKIDYDFDVTTVQTDVFQNAEEFQEFLKLLYQFYVDTNTKEFFQSVQLQGDMVSYLQNHLEDQKISSLFTEMELYLGNKNMIFPDQTVKYRSIMTLYRPFNASFFTIEFGGDIYLIGQQSPCDVSKKSDQFDIDQILNTTIHEFLHTFINDAVYKQNGLITELSNGRNKIDYAGPMYSNMEWHRIVDENIVRVVETAIFERVLHSKEKAYDLILKKEIQFGGMSRLQDMYDALITYEQDRATYESLDSYLPELISVMFH